MAGAATSFVKDRPDGHAAAMGACYSSGRREPSPSSLTSSQSKVSTTSQTRNSNPLNSGKISRSQSSCSDSSQKALRMKNPGKGLSTSSGPHPHVGNVLHASNLAHSDSVQGSAIRLQGVNGHAHVEGTSSATGEDWNQVLQTHGTSSLSTRVMAQQTSSSASEDSVAGIGDANLLHKVRSISAEVGLSVAATENPAAAHSSSILSPCHMHPSALSNVSTLNTPVHMQSKHIEIKSPSLSKSGVGSYEVLASRKQIAGMYGMPPSKLDNSLRRTATVTGLKIDTIGNSNGAGLKAIRSPSKAETLSLAYKGSAVKELCKNCKTGNWESVCYIANDGRIAATPTGPTTVCHFHHCNSPKCAANPNYQPPSSLPSKKVSLAKPLLSRSHSDKAIRTKPSNLHGADDSESCSGTKSSLDDGGTGNGNRKKEGAVHKLSAENRPDFEVKAWDSVDMCDASINSPEFYSEDAQQGATDSHRSCGCAEGDQRCVSPMHAGEQRVPNSMCPLEYCSGNDFDSHNDVAGLHLTGNTDGEFKDVESKAESEVAKVSQTRKSSMERMRQRYLDCLKEQEAETVRLKKQEMIARKQAGEWMLDSAIGEILQKLAPDGEAGVKVIVEAFETIMQQSDSDSLHDNAVSVDC
ncbi:hypothetical protein GOP47_0001255 [Adiantum capillus-veneris]|uniref:Calmodulin-binding domain-containing protein n=1 Tax=Adiantum capillus-veneris TaxID=13818 RepID=A0A9D4VGA0_ADICA|nr:hypothetical protein GOP47_0001255 [Adiantum capillus-veneris]